MKLQRNKGDNTYCGPAALALITGQPVSNATSAIRFITGQSAVRGVTQRDLLRSISMFGKLPVVVPKNYVRDTNPTLAYVLRSAGLRDRRPDTVFLITLTGHFIVLKGRKIYDNHNPEGVFLRKYQHRRKRVKAVFQIQELSA